MMAIKIFYIKHATNNERKIATYCDLQKVVFGGVPKIIFGFMMWVLPIETCKIETLTKFAHNNNLL